MQVCRANGKIVGDTVRHRESVYLEFDSFVINDYLIMNCQHPPHQLYYPNQAEHQSSDELDHDADMSELNFI